VVNYKISVDELRQDKSRNRLLKNECIRKKEPTELSRRITEILSWLVFKGREGGNGNN